MPTTDDPASIAAELSADLATERAATFQRWCECSLSTMNIHVLLVLAAGGPVPMHRLADLQDASISAMSGVVSRLEERGLVERTHDRQDRRVVTVGLTAAGSALVDELDLMKRQEMIATLELMSVDERTTFAASFRRFFEARRELANRGSATTRTGVTERAGSLTRAAPDGPSLHEGAEIR
jgi:DNA-binding MarR family transcriptional regulator